MKTIYRLEIYGYYMNGSDKIQEFPISDFYDNIEDAQRELYSFNAMSANERINFLESKGIYSRNQDPYIEDYNLITGE